MLKKDTSWATISSTTLIKLCFLFFRPRFFLNMIRPKECVCVWQRRWKKLGTQKITVPTKRLGTPHNFQCILMALRVLLKRR
jgi:hypothetical protein